MLLAVAEIVCFVQKQAFEIVYFVLSAGYLWVTPYVECSLAAMYEIMRGNLRPGVIDTTATIEE